MSAPVLAVDLDAAVDERAPVLVDVTAEWERAEVRRRARERSAQSRERARRARIAEAAAGGRRLLAAAAVAPGAEQRAAERRDAAERLAEAVRRRHDRERARSAPDW